MTVTAAYYTWLADAPGDSARVQLVEFSSVEEAKNAPLPQDLVSAFIFVDHGYYQRCKATDWVYTDYL